MKFDIARQPIVPAFLTLLALAILAACGLDTASPTAVGTSAEWGRGMATDTAIPGLCTPPLSGLIAGFQAAHPVWSRVIAGLLMLFAGMSVGRLTVRYNLYSIGTCLAIPLFAILISSVGTGPQYLTDFTAVALLALVTKNLSRACTNGYGFDALFRASLYLGLTTLIVPATLPLLLSLPLAILLFRRTLREAVVSLAGLLLAPILICYVNWGAGGTFLSPLTQVWTSFMQGAPLGYFRALALPEAALLGTVVLLVLFSILFFWGNAYAVGNKPRHILTLNVGIFFFAGAILCGPGAGPGSAAFLAIPSAILMPVLFVRINRSISLLLYLLLLASAVVNFAMQ